MGATLRVSDAKVFKSICLFLQEQGFVFEGDEALTGPNDGAINAITGYKAGAGSVMIEGDPDTLDAVFGKH